VQRTAQMNRGRWREAAKMKIGLHGKLIVYHHGAQQIVLGLPQLSADLLRHSTTRFSSAEARGWPPARVAMVEFGAIRLPSGTASAQYPRSASVTQAGSHYHFACPNQCGAKSRDWSGGAIGA
jgi:hypothetical protein